MSDVKKVLYLHEQALSAKNAELVLRLKEKLAEDLDSKEIRKIKKEIKNHIYEIEKSFHSNIDKVYDLDNAYKDTVLNNLNKREVILKMQINDLNEIISILNNGGLTDLCKHFEDTKQIFVNELEMLSTIRKNHEDGKLHIEDEKLCYMTSNSEEVDICNDVSEISSYAFYMNPYIKRITIRSEKITKLSPLTFAFCPNLEEIVLSSNIKRLEKMAIYHCPKITFLDASLDFDYVDNAAISYCYGMTSMYSDSGNYKAVDNVLLNNNKIVLATSLPILPNVEKINKFSFVNNPSLSLHIPSSVKQIEEGAIISSNFYELVLPESVDSLENAAIIDCILLSRLVIVNPKLQISKNAIINCPNLKEIVCPIELKAAISNIMDNIEDVKIIYF